MSLVLSSDNKTLTIVQENNEPRTRGQLMADAKFCANIACVVGYIHSLKMFGKDKMFSNSFVSAQFDAAIVESKEEEEGEVPFSVEEWFGAKKKKNEEDEEPDWLGFIVDEEMKRPGFCQSLLNCIDMEEKLETAKFDHLSAAAFPGRGRAGPQTPNSFFSFGGITAPNRK